jgi:two-component system, NarL family, response regulator
MNSSSSDSPGVPQPGSALSEIRILIADDHLVVREGLVAILNRQSDMAVIGEAGDGREAVEQWRELRPDITLMDLRMPEMSGVEAIEAIRREDEKALIIILTTYDSDEDVYRGIRAGAKAYLLKDTHREELVNASEPYMQARRSSRPESLQNWPAASVRKSSPPESLRSLG